MCRPWSPQLECQSVPVEQSTRQTQPRESKAQALGQEIALENTPLRRRINIVFIGEKSWGRVGLKRQAHKLSIIKTTVVYDCRNQGRVSLNPIRLDLNNEKSEQRRRVGTIHILHSAAPGCPRLKVVEHLCHFGPSIVRAGGQGRGNICITSESLALCPHHESLSLRNPKE